MLLQFLSLCFYKFKLLHLFTQFDAIVKWKDTETLSLPLIVLFKLL